MKSLFLIALLAVFLALASAKTTTTTTTTTSHTTTTTAPAKKVTSTSTSTKKTTTTTTTKPTISAKATSAKATTPTGKCTSSFKTHKLAPTPTPGKNSCKSFTDKFTSKSDIILQEKYNNKPSKTGPNWVDLSGTNGKGTSISSSGLELILNPPAKGQKYAYATTLQSVYALQYGTVVVEMKMNETPGFVNAFIFMSPNQDEIDWEFVGKEPNNGQSNYYFQGYQWYGVNGAKNKIPNGKAADSTYHKYGITWTPQQISWTIDGTVVRTVNKNNTWNACDKQYHFPYQASYIQLGVWDGSTSSSWSHGPIKWGKSPLTAYIKSIEVTCDTTWNKIV